MMIPALDLIEGRVVRLYQGDFSQQTTFDIDAVEQAQSYQAAGAQWLHLVDLDGAKNPQNRQLETLRTICAATNLNCQAGGGIRSTEDIEEILACGIKRVVIGSKAVTDPEQVEAWFKEFGAEKIVLALDVNIDADGIARVATHGWQSSSDVTLDDILKRFSALGCAHVLCTDISRDGTMQGSNVG
ncbi:MAG: HisA/HisF-related TIM barrel protein, partial [Pseudomonadota bacterium]|nr:HisA/HisF-related TIM barrel protein [Pseudomonadota bacterium]